MIFTFISLYIYTHTQKVSTFSNFIQLLGEELRFLHSEALSHRDKCVGAALGAATAILALCELS